MTVEMPHLPIYNLWTNRNATAGPKPAAYQMLVNMEEYGFPERLDQALSSNRECEN